MASLCPRLHCERGRQDRGARSADGQGQAGQDNVPSDPVFDPGFQSATLNGKPLNKPWFSHADIANGGKLVFQMGPAPNKSWGSAPDAAPPSMSAAQ